ncbi:MAG: S8 family serine peptidase [Phycisphaerales bacterium]|nr:S8 family serine peptidase [Phycisphaerales bacterium]MCB9837151.1 S8 family serine peptidase [Phycisphaera sp.]
MRLPESPHPEFQQMLMSNPAELTEMLRIDSTADRTIESWIADCRAITMEDPDRGVTASARLIELAESAASRRLIARALSAHCHALSYAGKMKQAIAIAERAIESAEVSGDNIALAEACMTAVQSHNVLGLREEALSLASRAGEIFKAEGDNDRSATAIMLAGVVLRMLDRPDEAIERYDLAFATVGQNPSLRAQLASNKAEALLDLGRFSEAKSAFESALQGFRSCNQAFGEAIVEGNLADLASRRGLLREALTLFLDASSKFRAANDEAEAARLEAEAAELFLAIGDHREALYRLPQAIQTLRQAGMQTELARALAAQGIALGRVGELDAALQRLEESEQLNQSHGQQQAVIRARALRGSLLLSAGRATEAAEIFRATLESQPLDPTRARLLIDHAKAYASIGKLDTARESHADASELAERLGLEDVDAPLFAVSSTIARLSGDMFAARQLFDRAIDAVERRRGAFTGDRLRAAASGGAHQVYEEGLRLAIATNDPTLAFRIIEHAHARTLRDAAANTRNTVHDDEISSIESDIAATLSQLEDARALARDTSHVMRLRQHLQELELRLASEEMRIQSQTGGAANQSAVPSLSAIQSTMPPDAVGIAIAFAGDSICRLTLTHSDMSIDERSASQSEVAKHCNVLFSSMDRAIVRHAIGRGLSSELTKAIDDELDMFGSVIFGGLEEVIDRASRVVLVLPGDLAQLPIACLRSGSRYIVERCTTVVAPSLSWAADIARRPQSGRVGLLAVGVADDLAPSINIELDAITEANRDATVLRNKEATFERLLNMTPAHDTLHLACHGEYSPADPMGSRMKLGDGWVSARRISELNLSDCHVVLGGCETGAVVSLAGEQFGLIRACMHACWCSICDRQPLATSRRDCCIHILGASPARGRSNRRPTMQAISDTGRSCKECTTSRFVGRSSCVRIVVMKKRCRFRSMRLYVAALVAASGLAHADDGDEPVSDQVIVQLFPGASIDDFNSRYGTATIDSIDGRPIYLLQLPSLLTHDEFESIVLGDPDLDKEELNFTASDPGGDTRSFYGSRSTDDYQQQLAVARMNVPQAQAISTGAGVTVAVLDTGIDSDHPLLNGRAVGGWNFITNSSNTDDIAQGVDTSGNGMPDEFVGHGTMISGMISLVAPDASIMPIVVLDSDGESTSWRVAKGIYYAIDRRVDVINLSLGTSIDTFVLLDAVDEARDHWITVVASAGNYGHSGAAQFPAAMNGNRTIAVAASDLENHITDFTNLGDHIVVAAPGVEAIGAYVGGGYQIGEGTSFSTAWVSGAAALIHGVGWDHSPRNVSRVIERSAQTYVDLPPELETLAGGGVLDVEAALLRQLDKPGCPADMNDDELLTPADFSAWVMAYNAGNYAADQNSDRQLDPSDLTAWIMNYNSGCPD